LEIGWLGHALRGCGIRHPEPDGKEKEMRKKEIRSAAFFAFAALLVTLVAGVSLAGETFTIDNVHSSLVFRVKHLGLADVYGRFNEISGTYLLDHENPSKSSVAIEIKTASVDTRVEKRDEHLRSPDFFHAEAFPLIAFESREISRIEGENYSVSGTLSLHGVSKPLTLTVHHVGSGKDPWGGYRTGFEGGFKIKRSDFGMDFMLGPVADEIELMVAVEGVRQ
jgi:polyisoprenoid-binding protein YceI